MNENLNLVEILKDCPKGTKLYSPLFGEVEFDCVKESSEYPIRVFLKNGIDVDFTLEGTMCPSYYDGGCVLFPSKEQRDWSKFKPKQPKFDPKTLKPFDKVLVRDDCSDDRWSIQLFSHIIKDEEDCPFACLAYNYRYCIPYNDDTKHLVGTTDNAPEFYRYLEDWI